MPQSFQSIPIHLIWSTKNRLPFINDDIEEELYKYMASIFRNYNSPSIIINGYKNHVHVLAYLSRIITIAKLMEEVKRESSKWIKTKGLRFEKFYWQVGYAAFGVGRNQLKIIINYIRNQKDHHRAKSFEEEYIDFLKRYSIDYNEGYMWD
jgi:REP element-mobilizing transposase RayT